MPRENKTKKRIVTKEEVPTIKVKLESLKHLPPELIEAIIPLSTGVIKQFQKSLTDTLNYINTGVGDKSKVMSQISSTLDALSAIDRRLDNGNSNSNSRRTRTILPKHKCLDSVIPKR